MSMLQRGKVGLKKHLKNSSGDELTLHFNELDDEGESQNLIDATSQVDEMKPINSNMEHSDSKAFAGNIRKQTHAPTHDKQASQLLHEKDVIEHPLMPTNGGSSEEEDVGVYPEKKKRSIPPPRPPMPKFALPQEKVATKSMISSVLFDQKARTQLFSSLKKGIQQYTHLNAAISDDEPNKDSSTSISSDVMSKSLRERALEPLNLNKKSLEQAEKYENAEVLRRRSSSENSIRSIHSKSLTDEKTRLENSESYHFHATRRSPAATVMSLSTLLADREDSIEQFVSAQSKVEVAKPPVAKELKKLEEAKPSMITVNSTKNMHPVLNRVKEEMYKESSSVSLITVYLLAIPVFLFRILLLPFSLQVATVSFFLGGILTTLGLCLVVSPKKQFQSFKPPYITRTVPYRIPTMNFNIHEIYKGWMNEIDEYDTETYHIAATTSVFITLEGSTLRLQTPRRNVSKRAVHGEKTIQPTDVIQSRVFSLQDARVYLIPYDLVKKRVWSKKYPICIEILERKTATDSPTEASSEQNVDEERTCTQKIYLFGRTLPEKERWFYRFQRAITICEQEGIRERSTSIEKSLEELDDEFEIIDDQNDIAVDPVKVHRNYYVYMCRLLPDPDLYAKDSLAKAPTKPVIDFDQQMIQFSTLPDEDTQEVITTQPGSKIKSSGSTEPTLDVAWFNVVVGRVMFDFFRLQKWADWVAIKLQKKLEKIRLPYFMEGLKLTAIDLGRTMPLVHKISLPRMDAQGIWLDMDITFNGSVQMTLETKLVLTRLGKKEETSPSVESRASAALNSEEEDSAESSDDDESILTQALPSYVQQFVPKGSENSPPPKHKGLTKENSSSKKGNQGAPAQEKKWMRFVDSVTKSKYFKKVAENAYVKRKFETVSNTPLILTAELNHCNGTLSLNIPPPPSDRIWYGFKEPPEMSIKAKPKFGERAVTVTPITDWIEKKLGQEFNKIFVLPNMDDIPVPIMFNNLPKQS